MSKGLEIVLDAFNAREYGRPRPNVSLASAIVLGVEKVQPSFLPIAKPQLSYLRSTFYYPKQPWKWGSDPSMRSDEIRLEDFIDVSINEAYSVMGVECRVGLRRTVSYFLGEFETESRAHLWVFEGVPESLDFTSKNDDVSEIVAYITEFWDEEII